ncbi:MAG: Hsp20/alpha crystallin family protein [Limisphaera sp.]|nr:Hsp20/alpha crystallin family protein [Limisphaera sp.]
MSPFERWEFQVGQIGSELYHLRMVQMASRRIWQPPINVFRLKDRYLICAELAGMRKEDISVRVNGSCVILTGSRPSPEPTGQAADQGLHVLALEIDYGPFERRVQIPEPILAERVTARYRDGLLWIEVPLASGEGALTHSEVRP